MAEQICRQKVLLALGTPCKGRKGPYALSGAPLSSQQPEKLCCGILTSPR